MYIQGQDIPLVSPFE